MLNRNRRFFVFYSTLFSDLAKTVTNPSIVALKCIPYCGVNVFKVYRIDPYQLGPVVNELEEEG